METINIDNLGLSELKDLLKEVKLYRDLKTQLWNRWEKTYKKIKNWEKTLVVESKKIFKNVFNLDVEQKDLKMEENAEIKWWIRIYMDDKVIDLSYLKIERELSK